MSKNKQWLPHLINSIPENVHGYTLSMYSIALEGWRRGLELKFYNKNRKKRHIDYSLRYKENIHYFSVTRSRVVTREAVNICKDKNLTKKYLSKARVPTPEGNNFDEKNTEEDIISYSNEIGYPLVLKPSDGTGGKGVIANIKNEEEMKDAISYVKHDLGFTKLIVERFFKGEDYRLYVMGDMVVGGIKRIPANVIGDGKTTIRELIKLKNKDRYDTPALYKRGIKVDKETHNMLKQQSYTLKSIPSNGERIFLKSKNNVSSGGDSVDVTDELTDEIKLIAVNAAKAIPGLVQCGVDIMVNKEENTGVIIEINSRPHITAQLFPWEGKARDIPKAIIDYYFPNTKSNHNQPAYYFDFESIWQNFKNGSVNEIVIPSCPKGYLSSTRFLISGSVQRVNYGAWIRKHALRLNLNGYVKHLDNGNCSVVISGSVESVNHFRKIVHEKTPKGVEVTKVVEKSRKSPVKVGFEILNPELDKELVDGYYPVILEGIKSHLNTKAKKTTKKKKGIKYTSKKSISKKKTPVKKATVSDQTDYKKEYNQLINSTSWKVTKPLRKIGKFLK